MVHSDIYLRDRDTDGDGIYDVAGHVSTSCISFNYANGSPAMGGESTGPAITADGQRIAFISAATNLVPLDLNGLSDAFVRDLNTGETFCVSVADGTGWEANAAAANAAISTNGRFAAFDYHGDQFGYDWC